MTRRLTLSALLAAAALSATGIVSVIGVAVADDATAAKARTPDGTSPVLILEDGDDEQRYNLGTLKKRLASHKLKFFDPLHKKEKRYAAFALHDLLRLGFADRWQSDQYSDVAFVALDGYTALGSLAVLQEQGGYVVYEDLDQDGWEQIGVRKTDPAPFYLIWTGKEQGPKGSYPWPYQLQTIRLMQFKEQYPKVFPAGVAEDSAVFRGYQLYRSTCFACHAMSRQGGLVGPDLNAPQNITEYRDEKMIRAFIRAPSQFRYTKMPDNPKLTDKDLDQLMAYLRFMAKHK